VCSSDLATFTPLQKQLDLGAGPGKPVVRTVRGGVGGIVLDTRGRPAVHIPTDSARVPTLTKWVAEMGEYP
jgi:hypothetical protein